MPPNTPFPRPTSPTLSCLASPVPSMIESSDGDDMLNTSNLTLESEWLADHNSVASSAVSTNNGEIRTAEQEAFLRVQRRRYLDHLRSRVDKLSEKHSGKRVPPKMVSPTGVTNVWTHEEAGGGTTQRMGDSPSTVVTPVAGDEENRDDAQQLPPSAAFEDESTIGDASSTGTSTHITSPGSRRIGIARPMYGGGGGDDVTTDEEESTVESGASRMGIGNPSYGAPAGGGLGIARPSYGQQEHRVSGSVGGGGGGGPNLNAFIRGMAPLQTSLSPLPCMNHSVDDVQSAESTQISEDSVDRIVHRQTAEGRYRGCGRKKSPPSHITLGSGQISQQSRQSRLSAAALSSDSRIIKIRLDDATATDESSGGGEYAFHQHHQTPRRLSSGSRPTKESASIKIFLLLLQPRNRIFELIQIIYHPATTTVGDLLDLIAPNATEPKLGHQRHRGLCRPKDGIEMTRLTQMASGSNDKRNCARIVRGEILVAIPEDYTGLECMRLSQPILRNPKLIKLLSRTDPLAPRRKGSRGGSSRRSGGSSVRSCGTRSIRSITPAVETVKEECEEDVEREISLDSEEMRRAIESAAFEAAAANAEVELPEVLRVEYHKKEEKDDEVKKDGDEGATTAPQPVMSSRSPLSNGQDGEELDLDLLATAMRDVGKCEGRDKKQNRVPPPSPVLSPTRPSPGLDTNLLATAMGNAGHPSMEVPTTPHSPTSSMVVLSPRRPSTPRRRNGGNNKGSGRVYVLYVVAVTTVFLVGRYQLSSIVDEQTNQDSSNSLGVRGLLKSVAILIVMVKFQNLFDSTKESSGSSVRTPKKMGRGLLAGVVASVAKSHQERHTPVARRSSSRGGPGAGSWGGRAF